MNARAIARGAAYLLLPIYKFIVFAYNEQPIYFVLVFLAIGWIILTMLLVLAFRGRLRVVDIWIYPVKGCYIMSLFFFL